MVKPEGQSHQIPRTHKEHKGDYEISTPPLIDPNAESPKSKEHKNDSRKRAAIGKNLRSLVMTPWEILRGAWKYFREMFWHEKSAFWTMVFTALLVFVTLKLVVVTNKVDETTRATQRAFLSFSGIKGGVRLISEDRKAYTGQEIYIMWSNDGTTPAKNAIAAGFSRWIANGQPLDFSFPESPAERIAVGSKQTANARALVSIDVLRAVRDGKARLFFGGWVVYEDIFPDDPDRLTEFCTELDKVAIGDITNPTNTIAWSNTPCPAPGHNCYDDECADYLSRIKIARQK